MDRHGFMKVMGKPAVAERLAALLAQARCMGHLSIFSEERYMRLRCAAELMPTVLMSSVCCFSRVPLTRPSLWRRALACWRHLYLYPEDTKVRRFEAWLKSRILLTRS